MTITLYDSSIGAFEQTLIAEGYTKTHHEYSNFLLFDIWQKK